jgi:hypothetical protein
MNGLTARPGSCGSTPAGLPNEAGHPRTEGGRFQLSGRMPAPRGGFGWRAGTRYRGLSCSTVSPTRNGAGAAGPAPCSPVTMSRLRMVRSG